MPDVSSCAVAQTQTPANDPFPVPPTPVDDPRALDDVERFRRFGEELDAVKARTLARMGAEDVAHVRNLNRFSRTMEVAGRVLIHFSPEPMTFTLGVVALFLHKQIQATEIGHTALHGAYDKLPGAGRFSSKTFRWDAPIDEESWRYAHNVRHHGGANVAGKDPDIHFGTIRLTRETPYNPHHRWQLATALGIVFPNFLFFIGSHVCGLNDAYFDNGRPDKLDILPDRSKESMRLAWRRGLRKYVPYYLYNYFFFPMLAGPMFWKVLLGNWLAETMRNVYSAATIFCGHVGDDVASYEAGTRAHGRGHWYAMQAEATSDFEVSLPISILCGGLERQIEHHLFPQLPPRRLREIAPEVRAICEKYGVRYRTGSWGQMLRKALSHIAELSHDEGGARVPELVRYMV
jgi:linoleoyl-CoA desaturase